MKFYLDFCLLFLASLYKRKKIFNQLVKVFFLFLVLSNFCSGQTNFPNKTVHFVVPFAAGGGVDTAARIIGQRLSEVWNQNVIKKTRLVQIVSLEVIL